MDDCVREGIIQKEDNSLSFSQKMLGIKRGLSLASRGEWPSDDEEDEDFELSDAEKEGVYEKIKYRHVRILLPTVTYR